MINLHVVLVGAGLMGYWHGHAAQRVGAKIVAIVDSDLSKAQALATHYPQAQLFSSLKIALATCSINVVHVCTPLNSHVELIEMALEAQCHVLAEKPLAFSLQETESLIALANKQGLKLNPVHQFPFQSGFLKMSEQRHQLGDIVCFTYTTCTAGGMNKSAELRRSTLLEILPHPIALLHHFFEGDFESSFDPNSLHLLRFTDEDLELTGEWNNTRIAIALSLRGRPTCNELRVIGTNGSAYIDLFHGYRLLEIGLVSRQAKITKPFNLGTQILVNAGSNLIRRALRNESAYPGLRELIKRFYHAITTDTPAPISDTEMLAAARFFDLCQKNI
ncbi:Gfo/Idh/MocA family oxidoreductase (plasmid) [Pseudanabaena biceps]|nr:Gfo/Idh/MocA family oxidoreductase [Pseudanabaena biceps]